MNKPLILIVETDPDWRKLLKDNLTRRGFHVEVPEDFFEALKRIASTVPIDAAVVGSGDKGSLHTSTFEQDYNPNTLLSMLHMSHPRCRTIYLTTEDSGEIDIETTPYAYLDKGWTNMQRLANELQRGPLVPHEMGQPIIDISEHRSPRRREYR